MTISRKVNVSIDLEKEECELLANTKDLLEKIYSYLDDFDEDEISGDMVAIHEDATEASYLIDKLLCKLQ